VVSGNFATPRHLLDLFDRSVERYRLFMLNAQGDIPDRDGVVYEAPFVGPGMRAHRSRLEYLPVRLSVVPRLFEGPRVPDVVLVQTSPAHRGRLSLGIEVDIMVAALERARASGGTVVAQINPRMPYTYGDGEIDTALIDFAIETEEPLASPIRGAVPLTAEAIGNHVAELVPDGATLQLGIGSIPDAVLAGLHDRRGLGVWSEMISDGVLDLERAAVLDAGRPIVASFLFGGPELYEWVDRNPRIRMLRTEVANDPGRIAANPRMVSVNMALQVDLFAQANANHVGGRVYSGFGGQTDFTVGAIHSVEGQAIIALPSWHVKTATSTVVPVIAGPVTSFQHSAIVTEQGMAPIFGHDQGSQAEAIIRRAAHPDSRDYLTEEACRLGIMGNRSSLR
jgi:acyl-CoA hydrolase